MDRQLQIGPLDAFPAPSLVRLNALNCAGLEDTVLISRSYNRVCACERLSPRTKQRIASALSGEEEDAMITASALGFKLKRGSAEAVFANVQLGSL